MKLTIIAAALAVAAPLAVAGVAHADAPGGTLEIGYTRADFKVTGVQDFGVNTVELRGGLQANKNLGVEMEGGFGVGDTTIHAGGNTGTVRQDWQVAIYGVGYLPVSKDADIIGRIGYGRTQLNISGPGGSGAGQANGATAGVGFRMFPGGGKNGFRVDYTHYFYNAGTTADAFGATYVRKF